MTVVGPGFRNGTVSASLGSIVGMFLAGGDESEAAAGSAQPRSAALADGVLDSFRAEVARQQLAEWLPSHPQIILDVSPGCPRLLETMVEAGHTVVHAAPRVERAAPPEGGGPGRLWRLRADTRSLDWVAEASVDAVVAEGGSLSGSPAAELTLVGIHRVLRPGGRLLLSVDSLVAGLARLADQGRWAELADVPAADVVLVPDGESVSRCFWPDELREMLGDAGFAVDWIRPRTVLADETVARALVLDPAQLPSLVSTELALAKQREGEELGGRLVASAQRL